ISLSGLTSGLKTLQVKGKNGSSGAWQASPTTAAWTVDTVKPITGVSPAGGTYGTPQTVTLSASETATIYYTTTGLAPTTASPKYTAPIAVNATTTLKFFAQQPRYHVGNPLLHLPHVAHNSGDEDSGGISREVTKRQPHVLAVELVADILDGELT
ncbi:hypothetical protein EG829_24025, partial [bacterium]|nr:hypothetical protein [bacterium]